MTQEEIKDHFITLQLNALADLHLGKDVSKHLMELQIIIKAMNERIMDEHNAGNEKGATIFAGMTYWLYVLRDQLLRA